MLSSGLLPLSFLFPLFFFPSKRLHCTDGFSLFFPSSFLSCLVAQLHDFSSWKTSYHSFKNLFQPQLGAGKMAWLSQAKTHKHLRLNLNIRFCLKLDICKAFAVLFKGIR